VRPERGCNAGRRQERSAPLDGWCMTLRFARVACVMTTHAERIVSEAMALPLAQRAELAHRLIASLDQEEADAQLDMDGSVEALRRLAEIERGEVEPISQDELFKRVRRRLAL
jgi:putative addiction module component (TIGR02574 family)